MLYFHPLYSFGEKLDVFFYIRVFFHRHWRFTGQQDKEGDHCLFHSTTSTRSRTLRHLFATLHVRWLSRIFNRSACVYQTATYSMRFTTLSNYHFDWLINDAMFVCLLDELILGFCYSNAIWETGGFELTSTIILVLQANRLTKFVSHSKLDLLLFIKCMWKFSRNIILGDIQFCVLSI